MITSSLPIAVKTTVTPMRTDSVLDRYPLEVKRLLEDDLGSEGMGSCRKRRRLTHLTPDEKNLRRKLKNRVAAQTARDRKKAQFDHLEDRVIKLERMNEAILQENRRLQQKTQVLAEENQAYREQLGLPLKMEPEIKAEPEVTSDEESEQLKSAEFQFVPQQKEHALTQHLMLTQILATLRFSQISQPYSEKSVRAAHRLASTDPYQVLRTIRSSPSLSQKFQFLLQQRNVLSPLQRSRPLKT